MIVENEEKISRREFQRRIQKRKQRRRRRRRARVQRLRYFRAIRSVRFWTKVFIMSMIALSVVFWAKFAFVYNIPDFAKKGPLTNVTCYVAMKPWWFGPPAFNLNAYVNQDALNVSSLDNPYSFLLLQLGNYDSIILQPEFIWVKL